MIVVCFLSRLRIEETRVKTVNNFIRCNKLYSTSPHAKFNNYD